jgi:hypothetical protein
MTRETRAGVAEPRDRIRSIYAARSAASGASPTGDFARIRTSDPGQSLRTAYVSHLIKAKDEAPREGGGLSDSALRRAYVAHAIGDAGSKR